MQTILFTGGGSAGHVTPNLALIKKFQQQNWHVIYIGSANSLEEDIVKRIHVPYYTIACGKLRRYFSWQNFLSPFKVMVGIIQAFLLCQKLKPNIVFSKGGFVAFPVVVGAWLNRIPVIAHESDLTPGLANRLTFPFARTICVTFPEGKKFFKNQHKVVVTGTPIRSELLTGDAVNGRIICKFTHEKPILFIYGGGLGSQSINRAVRDSLTKLLPEFQIIHICGKAKIDIQLSNIPGYIQFEYVNEELPDLIACADIVISRAGANSLYELLALQKPHLLIPLSKKASRGDQIANANYFCQQGLSLMLEEEKLTEESLLKQIILLKDKSAEFKQKLAANKLPDSVQLIYDLLIRTAK